MKPGWLRVIRHAAREARTDEIGFVASGIAFRVALAVFPAIALLVLLGQRLLADGDVQTMLRGIVEALPDSSRQIIDQAAAASLAHNPADRGGDVLGPAAPILGLCLTLWSANGGMRALFKGLNLIFDIPERRSFLRFTGVTLLFTVGTLVTLTCAMLLALVVPHILPAEGRWIVVGWLRWPVLLAVLTVALSLLYRLAPAWERGAGWPFITLGSAAGSFLLLATCGLFSWFTARFASLSVTYGSFSTVIAFLIWLWLCFAIVLAAAELDAAIDRETDLYRSGPGGE